jgi:hypothetical protein
MPNEIIGELIAFLSYLSFWWLLVGLFLVLARMPTPGMRMVDKAKFADKKKELDDQLVSRRCLRLLDQIVLYAGRYFFIYHYYRNDLVLLFVVGGASVLKSASLLLECFHA